MACRGVTVGFIVEMRLGNADDLFVGDGNEHDPIRDWGYHRCNPPGTTTCVANHVDSFQVVHGRFSNLHPPNLSFSIGQNDPAYALRVLSFDIR